MQLRSKNTKEFAIAITILIVKANGDLQAIWKHIPMLPHNHLFGKICESFAGAMK